MAEIRDTLRLDIDEALRQVRELENALNRALGQIVVDVETGPGVQRLEDDLKDAARISDDIADDAARIDRELRQADDSAEKLDKEFRDVARSADKAADQAARIDRETKQAAQSTGRLGNSLKGLAVGAAAGIGLSSIVRGFNDLISSSSNLEESINAINVQFGEGAEIILAFGQNAATEVGLATSEFNQLSVVTGALFSGFIADQRLAAEETIRFTQRATDLASVFNVTVPEALEALQASLRGEQEPIRRFGVLMDEAAVSAKALELGLAETTKEITTQDKSAARLAIIYEQTNKVAGDFANTQDSVANRMKVAAAEFENTKAAIGDALLPVMLELLAAFNDLTPAIRDSAPAIAEIARKLVDLSTPVTFLTGQLNKLGESGEGLATFTDRLIDTAIPGASVLSFFGDKARDAEADLALLNERVADHSEFQLAMQRHLNETARQLTAQTRAALELETQFDEGVNRALLAAADASDTANEAFRNTAFEMEAIIEPTQTAAGALESAIAGLDGVAESLVGVVDGLTGAVDPIKQAGEDIELTADLFVENLSEQVRQLEEFEGRLVLLAAEGFTNLAESLRRKGPELSQLAGEFLADPLQAQQAEDLLSGKGTEVGDEYASQIAEALAQFDFDDPAAAAVLSFAESLTTPGNVNIVRSSFEALLASAFSGASLPSFGFPPFRPPPAFTGDTEPIPEGSSSSSGGGLTLNVFHPTTPDLAGSVAQAANIVSTIPGLIPRAR